MRMRHMQPQQERSSFLRTCFDWVITLAISAGIVFIVHAFVAEVYLVPTGSMLSTVQLQDRLIGEKISYKFGKPQAGDIITFNDPAGTGHTLLKRVIATEGQTIDLRDGNVYVDNKKLNEPYVNHQPTESITNQGVGPQGAITFPYTVPAHCIWVMGDNRGNSLDSRWFGAVDISSVSSRGFWIIWPFDHAKSLERPH